MKNIILFFALLISVSAIAQVPKYGDIREDFPNISRKEYREAVSEYESEIKQGFDFSLSPIERVIQGIELVTLSNNIDSWGRKVLLPDNIKERVVNECGAFPVVVKIYDSGVDEDHNEYQGEWILPSSNYTGDPNQHWHGTHVLGIVWQMVGDVAREKGNIQLKGVQILNSNGSGSINNVINAIATETNEDRTSLSNGVGVVTNNSWGATSIPITALEDAIQKSVDVGVVWTAAAGNTGRETQQTPANSKNTIAVAALNSALKRAVFSTIGDFVDLAAPGQSIVSTLPDNKQGSASGTSMADPFITGLTVLACGKYGKVLHNQANAAAYLKHICTDIQPNGYDKETGWGIPYVVSMLDTDPCDLVEIDCDGTPPDDDPEDNPEPPYGANYIELQDGGFVMRWRYEDETQWRILAIENIRFGAIAASSEDEISQKITSWLPSYFTNRGIVMPDDLGTYSATWWTGKFLQYVAEQNGFDLEVLSVSAQDEVSRLSYHARGFSGSSLVAETRGGVESLSGVRLIEL